MFSLPSRHESNSGTIHLVDHVRNVSFFVSCLSSVTTLISRSGKNYYNTTLDFTKTEGRTDRGQTNNSRTETQEVTRSRYGVWVGTTRVVKDQNHN